MQRSEGRSVSLPFVYRLSEHWHSESIIMAKSLYIHIPFCSSRCLYCDFYSTIYQKDLADSFVTAICEQIDLFDFNFETIYIGGGTPTVLSSGQLKKMLIKIKKVSKKIKEFTVEVNPESLDKKKIDLFYEHGVNRISVGVQSFQQQKLKFLGRAHTANQAADSIQMIQKKGFQNISIDLIYGLPGETFKILEKDIIKITELPVTHLSAYMLTYEKGTSLFAKLKNNKFLSLSEAKVAKMYNKLIELLDERKFLQYEISNFSKKGYGSIHNFKYWKNESYHGLGPSAVSFLGKIRQKNISCLSRYIKAVKAKEKTWEYSEKLTDLAAAKETAALKIRTVEGIDFNWFVNKTGFNFLELEEKPLSELIGQKVIQYRYKNGTKTGIALTKKGILFADTVSSALL